jgi:phage gp36-like protein
MLPAKLGMKDDEEGGKPAVMIAVGKVKPKLSPRLGEESSDEPDEEEVLDPKQAQKDATAEIISCLGGSQQALKRLNAALEAHCRATYELIEKEEGKEPEDESEGD